MKGLWLSLILIFGMLAGGVSASQEGLLVLKAFALDSPGIGDSGPVKVSGAQSDRGITLLRIEAFGKTFNVGHDQLRQLRGFNANGVQITYLGGYVELGGRTIYVIFHQGFTSRTVAQRYVQENGSVAVRDRP
jgi:hypothetical protein